MPTARIQCKGSEGFRRPTKSIIVELFSLCIVTYTAHISGDVNSYSNLRNRNHSFLFLHNCSSNSIWLHPHALSLAFLLLLLLRLLWLVTQRRIKKTETWRHYFWDDCIALVFNNEIRTVAMWFRFMSVSHEQLPPMYTLSLSLPNILSILISFTQTHSPHVDITMCNVLWHSIQHRQMSVVMTICRCGGVQ